MNGDSRKIIKKHFWINKLLILLGIICILFATVIIGMFFNDTEISFLSKSAEQIKESFTSSECNEWDISANGDRSVIATLDANGVLIISGTGDMKDWSAAGTQEWDKLRDNIKIVIINSGVTNIGNYTLDSLKNVTSITIPNTVTTIGKWAIGYCTSLINIEIPDSAINIDLTAFGGCYKLKNINVDEKNKNYKDDDGVLYTKDGTKLIKYPPGKEADEYKILDATKIIEQQAFMDSDGLNDLVIPEGVESIGNYAFYHSNYLGKIQIPSSVTSIGNGAFEQCWFLTEIKIPEGVKDLGKTPLYGCLSLTYIDVDNNNKNYTDDNGVLYTKDKTKLVKYPGMNDRTEYTILEGTTSIEDKAFDFSKNLINLQIPSSVTSIGNYAFKDSENLISITIPEGVKSIGSETFSGCTRLQTINIPSSITSIGNNAFYNCSSLTNLYIPTSVISIVSNAFKGTQVTELIKESNTIELPEVLQRTQDKNDILYSKDGLEIINCTLEGTTLTIDEGQQYVKIKVLSGVLNNLTYLISYDTWDVSESGNKSVIASLGNNGILSISGTGNMKNYERDLLWNPVRRQIKKVEITDGVVNIGNKAFYNCEKLTLIEIPSSVINIGNDAFYNCCSLKNIVIPNSIKNIGEGAFSGCSNLTNIEISEGVTKIEKSTFSGCSSLTNIELPNVINSIGEYAFSGCYDLVNINIPNSAISIGEYAFQSCDLTNIEIPSNVTKIEGNAFNSCDKLINIKVDNNNISYCDDNGVLYTKDKKVIVKYPDGKQEKKYTVLSTVEKIGTYAFHGNEKLTTIEIQNGVTNIEEYAFGWCENLTNIKIPNSVINIGNQAFNYCDSLEEIKIPEGVTSIGDYVFNGCENLTTITIPKTVEKIGLDAFRSCDKLTIICENESVAQTYAKQNNINYIMVIKKINPKTTAQQIITKLGDNMQCQIQDLEGKVITSTSIIGSGYKVKMTDGEEYTLIIWGDYNGDGKIGIAELARASRAAIQPDMLPIKEEMLLDVSMDGNIKVSDLAALSRLAVQ